MNRTIRSFPTRIVYIVVYICNNVNKIFRWMRFYVDSANKQTTRAFMHMKLLNIWNRNNYQEQKKKRKKRKETIQKYGNIYNSRIILFRYRSELLKLFSVIGTHGFQRTKNRRNWRVLDLYCPQHPRHPPRKYQKRSTWVSRDRTLLRRLTFQEAEALRGRRTRNAL